MLDVTNAGSVRAVVYDVPSISRDVIPPTPITPYSRLTIPQYFRALTFLAGNLASFPRSIRIDQGEADNAHPLNRILRRRPNDYASPSDVWSTWYFHAALSGNGYLRIERGENLEPVALHTLQTEDVVPRRLIDAEGRISQWYVVRGVRDPLPSTDVLHLKTLSYDGMIGIDPTGMFASTFQRALTIDRYATLFLKRGSMIRAAVEFPAGLSKEQVSLAKERLRQYQGVEAEDDVLILTDGAKLANGTMSPQQSQLVEQTKQIGKSISQLTGVPPWFLYEFDGVQYNNNAEQMGLDVVRHCFRLWIEQAEDEMTLKLLTADEQDAGYSVHLNPDALLRGDTKTQTDVVTAQTNAGLVTKNEARGKLGYPQSTDPDANKLKTLGDTAPPPTKAGAPTATASTHAASTPVDAFAALQPLITEACARVDRKTDKAFDNAAGKEGMDRTRWSNVFAESQAKYASETLSTLSDTLKTLGAEPLDVASIAERYGAAIRKRATNGDTTTLTNLVTGQSAGDEG